MPKNYKQLTESVKSRINPENLTLNRLFNDELATISYSEVLTYIRVAMKGVEPEYTQKSKDAGERVKEHLTKSLKDVSFAYQGSVMTDTHIKGYSDIDLLTISEKFYSYDANNIRQLLGNEERKSKYYLSSIEKLQNELNVTNYLGSPLDDLRALRLESENTLSSVYSICDKSKPKSIKIKNLNLNREVDVVIANWYDDVTSIVNDKGDFRGIQVYNKDLNSRLEADYPFLSIKRINERSAFTVGRLKKMIRFMKNSKTNSDQNIELSSFDINAICYDIPVTSYQNHSFYELVSVIYYQIKSIFESNNKADNLVSVDGREFVFKENNSKKDNLGKLLIEVEGIFSDLKKAVKL